MEASINLCTLALNALENAHDIEAQKINYSPCTIALKLHVHVHVQVHDCTCSPKLQTHAKIKQRQEQDLPIAVFVICRASNWPVFQQIFYAHLSCIKGETVLTQF